MSAETGAADWPEISGRLEAGGHSLGVRVYYEDTDTSGLVYHASYLRFMERGRTDLLRLLGIGHKALGSGEDHEALFFAVRRMAIEFLRPAAIDDLLTVETSPQSIQGARGILLQRVVRDDALLVSAEVTVALVNPSGRPRRFPPHIRDRLDAVTSKVSDSLTGRV